MLKKVGSWFGSKKDMCRMFKMSLHLDDDANKIFDNNEEKNDQKKI